MEKFRIFDHLMYVNFDEVHDEKISVNEECFSIMFTGKSLMQWSGLKTLYVCNCLPKKIIAKQLGKMHEL